MSIRKLLSAAGIGAMALLAMPGEAMAATAAHEFRIVKLGANP